MIKAHAQVKIRVMETTSDGSVRLRLLSQGSALYRDRWFVVGEEVDINLQEADEFWRVSSSAFALPVPD